MLRSVPNLTGRRVDGAAALALRRRSFGLRPPGPLRGVEAQTRRELRLMILPAVVVVLAVNLFPLLYSLWVSFHSYEPLSLEHPFSGFENYRQVLSDSVFRDAVVRTVLFVVIVVPVQTILGLALALMVERRRWARRLFFPIFLLPVLIMPIVVGYMWRLMWEAPFGAVNEVASFVLRHRVDVDWLNHPRTAFIALIVTEVWQWTPFMFVVLLAALVGVPEELREAAAVDGARAVASFRFVLLPAIAPVLLVAVIIRILDSANFFATVYAITGGGPGTSTFSLAYYIWNLAHFGRDGAATAASFLFLVALATLAGTLVARLLRRQSAVVV